MQLDVNGTLLTDQRYSILTVDKNAAKPFNKLRKADQNLVVKVKTSL